MRHAVLSLFSLVFAAGAAFPRACTQDPGTMAAQQAMQMSQQASQQAQQASQQAMEASQQASQQALQDSQNAAANARSLPGFTRSPQFSVRPGTYPAAVTVRLHSPSAHPHIFYTLDGWTPTTASSPYTAPLQISASTTVQAIAIAPGFAASRVTTGDFRIASSATASSATNGTAAPPLTAPLALSAGTPVELRFPQELTSETAYVGQSLRLVLSRNLVVDGHLVAPSGTPASAVVTEADTTRRVYQAGVVSFTLRSMTINGVEVPLAGTRTLEGTAVGPGRASLFLIPVAGPLTLLKKGAPAIIPAGAELQGTIAGNAVIPPPPAAP